MEKKLLRVTPLSVLTSVCIGGTLLPSEEFISLSTPPSEIRIMPTAYLPTLAMMMMIMIMKKLMDLESVLKIACT